MIIELADEHQFEERHYRGDAEESLGYQSRIVLVPIFPLEIALAVVSDVDGGDPPEHEGQDEERQHGHLVPIPVSPEITSGTVNHAQTYGCPDIRYHVYNENDLEAWNTEPITIPDKFIR